MDSILALGTRSLTYAAALVLTGTVAWRAFLTPRLGACEGFERLERRIALLGLATSVLLLPILVLRLWQQVMEFRDPFVPFSEDLEFILQNTTWGTVWFGQVGAALLLPPVFLLLVRRAGLNPPGSAPRALDLAEGETPLAEAPARWWGAGALVSVVLLGLSLTSHAMSMPSGRWLAVSVDMLHQMAVGSWIGTLAVVLLATPRGTKGTPSLLPAQLNAFGLLAMVAVGLMVFSGGLLTMNHTGELADLWQTEWGRVLGLKVLVALGVMAVGGWNWRRGVPEALSSGTTVPLRRGVLLELGLSAVVVILTALLVTRALPPGAH